jgi:hypothetical protein
MNLKDSNCNMTCFPLFVDVVTTANMSKPLQDIHKLKVVINMVVSPRA